MKTLLPFWALLVMVCACTSRQQPVVADGSDAPADSLPAEYEELADSVVELIAETPLPKAADELFDDFIFNFAANGKLQQSRIAFPLKVITDGKEERWSKANWKTEHFFMDQDFYTLIFGSNRQRDAGKDTTINHAVVEKIFLDNNTIERYIFDRRDGLWKMNTIENQPISESDNASFLQFYRKFSTDSAYQAEHLSSYVKYVGPDPDDDFTPMEGIITPDTWPAFAPEMPSGKIYNIIYGNEKPNTNQRIFLIRGIANGLEQELIFQKEGGRWKLTQLTQ